MTTGFLQRLKARKLVQWAIAYIAFAFALIQVLDAVADSYAWPHAVMHIVFGVLTVGLVVVLLLAWYHGEQGRQWVSGPELLLIALALAIGGGLLWHFARGPATNAVATTVASTRKAGVANAQPNGSMTDKSTARSAMGASAATPSAAPVATPPIPAKSVAVLPFENLSADKNNAYFADGMQDLILTKLADIGDLKVISRTSTLQYGSHPENLKLVGKQLGVAAILEGSVQKAGKQVLINVQLINAKTDGHIWAQSYQRTLDNIFGVEGEVAAKVADALNAKLTQAESAKVANVPTQNPAALDAYLRGERYLALANAGHFKSAIPDAVSAYRSATEADPKFALAWARLALAQSMLNYTSIDVSKATAQQALANAKRALALAPNLPQAHLALGYVYRFDFAEYDKALDEFRTAHKGLPNNAEVEAAIAYIDGMVGNTKAAAARLKHAMTLDPRNPNLALSLGQVYTAERQYDHARIAFQRVLAIAPDDPEGYSGLAQLALLQNGDVDAALAELDKTPSTVQASSEIVFSRAGLLLTKRDYAAAQKVATQLQAGGRFITPTKVAMLRARVNELSGHTANARKGYQHVLALARAIAASGNARNAVGADIVTIYAEAGLGNKQAAIHAARHAHAAAPASFLRSQTQYALAHAYAKFGDAGRAVPILDALLRAPAPGVLISVPLLKLDPTWDPIRHAPAFQTLLKKYATHKPATRPATPRAPSSQERPLAATDLATCHLCSRPTAAPTTAWVRGHGCRRARGPDPGTA